MVKMLIIGFDAMDYNIALKFLPESGFTVFPLYAEVPATAPSWTSIHTGLSVEEHGVREMWQNAGYKSHSFFWEILNDHGYTCELMNIPATYPPRPVKRYIVCGFPAPIGRRDYTYPKELMNSLPQDFQQKLDIVYWDPDMRTDWFSKIKDMDPEDVFSRIKSDAEFIINKTVEFHANSDLVYIQFSYIDRLCSHLISLIPKYGDSLRIKDIYKLAIHHIKRLEQDFSPEKVMIISDHGDGWVMASHSRFGVLGVKNISVDKKFPENTDIFRIVLREFGVI